MENKRYRPFKSFREMVNEYKKRCNNEIITYLVICDIPLKCKDNPSKGILLHVTQEPFENTDYEFDVGQYDGRSISNGSYLLDNYTFPDGSPCGVKL